LAFEREGSQHPGFEKEAQQPLGFAKVGNSFPYKNDSRCSAMIRRLEGERQLLLDQHAANDTMVQQAAREFGKSEADAKHYTLRTYLQEITQAMVQQIAAGGFGNVKNQPVFKNVLNNMDKTRIRELEAYKNRLEDEVQRLGGNVQIMRLGLDPRRPAPFRELNYDYFSRKTFSIYQALCLSAKVLTDVFIAENVLLVPWEHAPPRSEASNQRTIPASNLEGRLIIAESLKFYEYEILVQCLVREELMRLMNRVIYLKRTGTQFPPQDNPFYNEKFG
jgi:hypothetical protein